MSTISAGTTSGTALVSTGNTAGTLVFQTNGTTTALTLGTDQSATFVGAATFSGGIAASTLTAPTINDGYTEETYTANSSTAITLSLANGSLQIITLTGTCTITMPTASAGKSFMLLLKSGAGSYAVTWTTVQWPSGTAPTLTSTASKMDKFVFTSDGTYWYGSVAGQNYTA